jgi:hypothetical protein
MSYFIADSWSFKAGEAISLFLSQNDEEKNDTYFAQEFNRIEELRSIYGISVGLEALRDENKLLALASDFCANYLKSSGKSVYQLLFEKDFRILRLCELLKFPSWRLYIILAKWSVGQHQIEYAMSICKEILQLYSIPEVVVAVKSVIEEFIKQLKVNLETIVNDEVCCAFIFFELNDVA